MFLSMCYIRQAVACGQVTLRKVLLFNSIRQLLIRFFSLAEVWFWHNILHSVEKPLVLYKSIISVTDIDARYKTFFSVLTNNIV